MTDVGALQAHLRQTFRGAFRVRDVAEALPFDTQMPARTALERRSFAVVLRLAEGLESIVNVGGAFVRPRRARPRKRAT